MRFANHAGRWALLTVAIAAVAIAIAACSDYGEDSPLSATTDGGAASACACTKGAACIDAGVCSNDPIAVTGGGDFACALLADGSVWCWGDNALGQLGRDAGAERCQFTAGSTAVSVPCGFTAGKVQNLPSVRAVAAGYQFACAATTTAGEVYCWGDNPAGNLGSLPSFDMECTNSTEPVDGGGFALTHCSAQPRKVAGVSDVVELTASAAFACALTRNHEVYCWGGGADGELGSVNTEPIAPKPVKVEGLPNDITQISSGVVQATTCAVSAVGGVLCWGNDLGREDFSATPQAATGGGTDPLAAVSEVTVGNGYACGRAQDGALKCWGNNSAGELGQKVCDVGAPSPPLPVNGIPRVTSVSGRWNHSCALDAEGHVYCWGMAILGALGRGSIDGQFDCLSGLPGSSAAMVPNLPPAAVVSVGIQTSFAIDRDHKLWGWGTNDIARAGHEPKTSADFLNCGDPHNQSACNPTPMLIRGLP